MCDYGVRSLTPSITIIVNIIISNFFFVGMTQHFKKLQIVFKPRKLIKANYKRRKMKVLKDTFQHNFKLHNYWEKKAHIHKHTRTNAHIFVCTDKRTYAYTHMQVYTHAHIGTIIYTQTFPYTHRLTKI